MVYSVCGRSIILAIKKCAVRRIFIDFLSRVKDRFRTGDLWNHNLPMKSMVSDCQTVRVSVLPLYLVNSTRQNMRLVNLLVLVVKY